MSMEYLKESLDMSWDPTELEKELEEIDWELDALHQSASSSFQPPLPRTSVLIREEKKKKECRKRQEKKDKKEERKREKAARKREKAERKKQKRERKESRKEKKKLVNKRVVKDSEDEEMERRIELDERKRIMQEEAMRERVIEARLMMGTEEDSCVTLRWQPLPEALAPDVLPYTPWVRKPTRPRPPPTGRPRQPRY